MQGGYVLADPLGPCGPIRSLLLADPPYIHRKGLACLPKIVNFRRGNAEARAVIGLMWSALECITPVGTTQ